ncbi:hypothetical protein NLJ89_g2525 [Agrocybe chaxingu]|uniref:Cytochrome P450 n=1 Tax=Agrocybe chaxingu TaxID=84603 RepID=A0A9W8K6P3_9AGAR|nr:hypothetical protein NLJ89_g2525 [Agrocybe chaxingu]
MAVKELLVSFLATIVAYFVFKTFKFLYAEWTSPLHALYGPPSTSFIYGNIKEISDAENSVLHEKWVEEYGPTLKYKAFFGMNRLYTTDPKALNHILMNSMIYQKPEAARYNLSRILGNGVLVVEGDKHRQQRRIMNPAFGPAQTRELTSIFIEKSIELRDIWATEIKKPEVNQINVLSWLSRMTLDVIGLAGFDYKFNALTTDPKKNELNRAFSVLFTPGNRMALLPLIKSVFPSSRPILKYIPEERAAEMRVASETMNRIAAELLRDSKAAIYSDNGKVDKFSWKGKDLLSLLVRANMATDLPPSQRMTDEDVLAQVPTFLVAGHETTSTATTWALYALSLRPDVQTKLRDELLAVVTDNPTMDELNALPYLDMVVRETLRVHAPVPSTIRVAVEDDVLPLSIPVAAKDGSVLREIRVQKGQTMLIPILAMNRAKTIWGEDAMEFKPERWEKVPEAATGIPGVWGNMLTFLGGPRACIGYRFSLVETKAILFTLVRAFEFELAVPADDIIKKATIVQRPMLKSDLEAGNQLPLRLRPVQRN